MQCTVFSRTALAAALLALGASAPFAYAAGTTGSSSDKTATNTGSSKTASSSELKSTDKKFIEEAARGGMAEIQLGQLAQQKASNDQVKQFASRMVTDHNKANDQLKKVAQDKGITPPSSLDKDAQKEYDKLSKMSGADFDREYMSHMVKDHKKDVSEFRSEARSASDPQVKDFAASTLPTIEQHLQMAQSTESAVKNEGKSGKSASSSSMSSPGAPSSSSQANASK